MLAKRDCARFIQVTEVVASTLKIGMWRKAKPCRISDCSKHEMLCKFDWYGNRRRGKDHEVGPHESREVPSSHALGADHVFDAEAERVHEITAHADLVMRAGACHQSERDAFRTVGAEVDVLPPIALHDLKL